MSDPTYPEQDAKRVIASRKAMRDATQLEHRGALALEVIADELTALNAEVKILRLLFATYAVRPHKP